MKSAYAGGGDFDPYQQHVQNVAQEFMSEMEEPTWAESLTYQIGDSFGYEWIIGLSLIGALVVFRKRVKKFIQNWI